MTDAVAKSLSRQNSVVAAATVLFVASMATLVQSFVAVKLAFLALFVVSAIVDDRFRRKRAVYMQLIFFYLSLFAVGIVWAFVGFLNPAAYEAGVMDALRLYCLWSVAFLVLYTLLRSRPSLQLLHKALVLAGIMISAINFAGLADQIGGWGLFSEDLRKELDQYIGIYDGYIQITSQNIGSLFFIVPYLVTLQFRADAAEANSALTKLSLALCLIVVLISGRRGLLLVVGLTPCVIVLVSAVSGSFDLMKAGARRFLSGYTALIVVGIGIVTILPESVLHLAYVDRLTEAFSSDDERTIQKPYLIEAFKREPIVGSGFGAAAMYLRNDERPWTGYELTYYQLLFNLGIVGMTVLAALFLSYLIMAIRNFRRFKDGSAVPFGLFIAFVSLLIGAYSNRYLGSFDLLFYVGLLPYLSTFRRGFTEQAIGT